MSKGILYADQETRCPNCEHRYPVELAILLGKISFSGANGCWIWTGGKSTKSGYGAARWQGRTITAHRAAYQALVGPIPPGLVLDHLCRVRLCVNPSHLEPVTNGENIRRGEGPRLASARMRSRTHCSNGHEFTPANTRRRSGTEYRHCRTCDRNRVTKKRSPEAER